VVELTLACSCESGHRVPPSQQVPHRAQRQRGPHSLLVSGRVTWRPFEAKHRAWSVLACREWAHRADPLAADP